MRGNFVTQVALFLRLAGLHLIAQIADFVNQEIDLLLLAKNCHVQFFNQIFCVTDFDFEFGQAGVHGLAFRCGVRRFVGFFMGTTLVQKWQGGADECQDAKSKNNPAFVHGLDRKSVV